MAWRRVDEKGKIKKVIDYLVSSEIDLEMKIGENEVLYSGRAVYWKDKNETASSTPGLSLIIQDLEPKADDNLIQTTSDIHLEFSIHGNIFQCPVHFQGESRPPAPPGLILSFPTFLNIQEKRREDRIPLEMPEFITVEFSVAGEGGKRKHYELNVVDCSAHGLGLLVTDEDMDLIQSLNPGDKIEEITYYASSSMIKVEGTVVHKTKVHEGKYRGAYVIGIESPEIIESCTAR